MSELLGYARVSTDKQDLAGQTARLEAAGASRIFSDVMTGKRIDRPGLETLIDYARPGDTLCVVRIDRLGRSLKDLIEIVARLGDLGIHFKSLEDPIDTSSAAGELQFHIFASLAQFERRLISERTKDGLAAARAKGKLAGRPKADADAIRAAIAQIDAGMSVTKAAMRNGIGRSTLYAALQDRTMDAAA